jgi:hypothetical protein
MLKASARLRQMVSTLPVKQTGGLPPELHKNCTFLRMVIFPKQLTWKQIYKISVRDAEISSLDEKMSSFLYNIRSSFNPFSAAPTGSHSGAFFRKFH